jgi:hypothetical protein
LERPGSHTFSPTKIGEDKYRRTMAALSRSCARLGERGLVKCLVGESSRWSGVEITDAGRAWVAAHPESAGAFDVVTERQVEK